MESYIWYKIALGVLIPVGLFSVFMIGYSWPRDVELDSTKPIVFEYEITKEAAKFLILKSVKGLECEK